MGVDAARALALVGMFAAHILPPGRGGAETIAGAIVEGRSSALFAVLAGVGVALGSGGQRRPPDAAAHLGAAAALVVRGALVTLLGLWLVRFDAPVAVILAYYGVLFVAGAPLLRLPARVLAAGAVGTCVLAPVLSHLLRAGLPQGPGEQPGLAALAAPGDLLVTLTLTGYYPALPWLTYLLAGMAVGRLDLRSVRTAGALLAGGIGLAVLPAGASALVLGPGGGAAELGIGAIERRRYGTTPTDSWWWLAIDTPHTGTPFDLASTTGSALAVLGAALLVARYARVLAVVPAAVGAIPLTLYTLHVLALAAMPPTPGSEGELLLWHVAGAVVVAVALWLAGLRGPLEWAVSSAAGLARRAVTPATLRR
jgi:hypothetical protein